MMFVWLLVLAGAPSCLLVAWVNTGRGADAKGQRGRLRDFRYCLGLVAAGILLGASVYPVLEAHHSRIGWVALLLGIAAILVLRPRLAKPAVMCVLVALGLFGVALARHVGVDRYTPWHWYGLLPIGPYSLDAVATCLILVQAYGYLLLGGWLAYREILERPRLAALVLGRMAESNRRYDRWGLFLPYVALAFAALVGSNAWFVLAIALVTGAIVAIRRWPTGAARMVVGGLLLLGLLGLVRARYWSAGGDFGYFQPGSFPRFGLVDVSNRAMGFAAGAEALAFLALGCWLAPRVYPDARRLLGLASDTELARRVQRLTETRAVAVDTAAADLRRLERDLHDGAQARLVALGMSLRAAERLIETNPPAAAALVAEAREASARALTELRELVRGVHPPVLADRGLADAIRALALDCPLDVDVDVDLPGRLPAPVETACYFAVAEVLTNAAKHSGSRAAKVAMSHGGGRLNIMITDFGLGGADPAAGTGLAGVEKRLATFDGIMAVNSPVGGPTIVVLEVPCALSLPRISSS